MNTTELEAIVVQQGRRIAALETEIGVLKANAGIARKATEARPAAQPVQPEGASVRTVIEPAKIAMPTTSELRKLLDVVLAAYPKLRTWSPGDRYANQDAAEFFRHFSSAFWFVAGKGRTDGVDEKHSVAWWAGEASDWCALQNNRLSISSGSLWAAVIAAGDIGFVQGDNFGNVWAFALAPFGGRPATEAWRNTLRGNLDSKLQLPGKYKPLSSERSPTVRFGGDAR